MDEQHPQETFGFWQLWNMSIGFLGIQYGWTLQIANTSAIYEYLGASVEQIPIFWLAAPLSGLIAQPLIGYVSDRTWTSLGRRRPFFLVGAICSSVALILMPNSSSLWMAAGLLWMLDTSVNVSMEPFRAFVADLLPSKQQTQGFTLQSCFIGAGSVLAALSPWTLSHVFRLTQALDQEAAIPPSVKFSFYLGSAIFLGTVLWTVFTTAEPIPKDFAALEKRQAIATASGFTGMLTEISTRIRLMPDRMQNLAGVQFFTWLGIFCVFLYFPPAIAYSIFGAVEKHSELYNKGIEWAGICIAAYNAVCFAFSWVLPMLTREWGRPIVHGICLACGGLSILSLGSIHNQYVVLLPMIGFGMAWASTLSIPYAMLSDSLPGKNLGLYMGLFNGFIVIPQIIAALGLGWVMRYFLGGDRLSAVMLGGAFLLIAAYLASTLKTQEQLNDLAISNEKNA